ncbi:MAG: lactoylglutathione lyase [Planctomycetota bacterium]|jgi:lactoylglutathione lyase
MSEQQQSKLGAMVQCLRVAKLTASCAFYGKLGFRQAGGSTSEGWAILNDGENELHLFQGHIASNTLNFRGGDVFEIAAELKRQGVAMKTDAEREGDGSDGAWIEDPDGNAIYFNTSPEERR